MKKLSMTSLILVLAMLMGLLAACGETTADAVPDGLSSTETSEIAEVTEASEPEETAQPERVQADREFSEEAADPESAEDPEIVGIPPLPVTLPLKETETVTIWDCFPPQLTGFMEGPWDCTGNVLLEEATNVHLDYTTVSTEVASE